MKLKIGNSSSCLVISFVLACIFFLVNYLFHRSEDLQFVHSTSERSLYTSNYRTQSTATGPRTTIHQQQRSGLPNAGIGVGVHGNVGQSSSVSSSGGVNNRIRSPQQTSLRSHPISPNADVRASSVSVSQRSSFSISGGRIAGNTGAVNSGGSGSIRIPKPVVDTQPSPISSSNIVTKSKHQRVSYFPPSSPTLSSHQRDVVTVSINTDVGRIPPERLSTNWRHVSNTETYSTRTAVSPTVSDSEAVRQTHKHTHTSLSSTPQQTHPVSHHSHHHNSHHHHNEPHEDSSDVFPTFDIPTNVPWSDYHTDAQSVVAFYNVYIANTAYIEIVHEQLDLLNLTGLFTRLDVVYYVTIGLHYSTMENELKQRMQLTTPLHHPNTKVTPSDTVTANDTISDSNTDIPTHSPTVSPTKFRHLHNSVTPVDETLTLSYLYDFCANHPQSVVLYFHDKGSYNFRTDNIYFRNFLDCYVLNTQCLDTLLSGTNNSNDENDANADFDTCGWRWSPVPNTHYSGNFWWARCAYVNTLFHPGSMMTNATFAVVTNTLSRGIVSSRRYLPEAWIGSGPRIRPADCMPAEIDTTFLCCYDLQDVSVSQCPNHIKHIYPNAAMLDNVRYSDASVLVRERLSNIVANSSTGILHTGSVCKKADVLVNGDLYRTAYLRNLHFHERKFDVNVMDELVRRSQLWYGEPPLTYMKAARDIDRDHHRNSSLT